MALRKKSKGSRTRAESRARYYIREEAKRRGWNVAHLAGGGEFLEENEIVAHFADIGLGLEKPDFLMCLAGNPIAVVEAKSLSSWGAMSQTGSYATPCEARLPQ